MYPALGYLQMTARPLALEMLVEHRRPAVQATHLPHLCRAIGSSVLPQMNDSQLCSFFFGCFAAGAALSHESSQSLSQSSSSHRGSCSAAQTLPDTTEIVLSHFYSWDTNYNWPHSCQSPRTRRWTISEHPGSGLFSDAVQVSIPWTTADVKDNTNISPLDVSSF